MTSMIIVKRPSISMKIEWSSIFIGVPSGFGEPRVITPYKFTGIIELKTGVQQRIRMTSKIIIKIPRIYCFKKRSCPRPIKQHEAIFVF